MWLAGVVLLCSLAVGVLSTASEEVSCASGDGAPCLDWDLGECATTIDTELVSKSKACDQRRNYVLLHTIHT